MFFDRSDAGKQLGAALMRYRGTRPLIEDVIREQQEVIDILQDAASSGLLASPPLPSPETPARDIS